MKLFLDTEFNEFGGDLISLALVPEDGGAAFYEVLPCPAPGEWVKQHVMPVLRREAISHHTFRRYLQAYLRPWPWVTIIADWPDDIQYFCRMLITGPGHAIATPPLVFELRRDLSSEGSDMPHNALADALALREQYRSIRHFNFVP